MYSLINYLTCTKFSDKHKQFLASVTVEFESSYYSEAVLDPKWREVIRQEIEALEPNGTWKLTQLLIGKWVLWSKWVYKIKNKADGIVERIRHVSLETHSKKA